MMVGSGKSSWKCQNSISLIKRKLVTVRNKWRENKGKEFNTEVIIIAQ